MSAPPIWLLEDSALRRHGLTGSRWQALGTTVHVVVAEPSALPPAVAAVEAVLGDVDAVLSRFRADSELTRVNQGRGSWQPVSPLLLRALRVALDAAQWTGGRVDPTVGATLIALGYDRTFTRVARDGPAPVLRTVVRWDWRAVELDDERARVRVPQDLVLDLGATAKGLAADLAAEAAADAAGCGVLVNLGGDLAVAGAAPPRGWEVTVGETSDPEAAADGGQVVVLRSGGLATSGVGARRWRRGGVDLHHLLDPRTGRPTDGPWRTISVTAQTCVLADAASTAAVVAGAQATDWLRERGFPARLVGQDGSVVRLGGWPAPVVRAAG